MEQKAVQALVTVVANHLIAKDVYQIDFAPHQGVLQATPGQFVNIAVSGSLDPLLRRPFSICRLQEDGSWSVVYRVQGRGTELLSQVRCGDTLDVLGPLGQGFEIKAGRQENVFLVGGGVGVPPLFFLAQRMVAAGLKPQPFLGFTSANQAILQDAFTALGLHPLVATDDGSLGHHGLVTELLPEAASAVVYACGPTPMLKAVARWSRSRAFSCQLSLEARMACGVGACLGCVCQGNGPHLSWQRVCKEGPVFSAQEVFPDA